MTGIVEASAVLVCLATAPFCDQEHSEVYVQIRRGTCDLTSPLIKPYLDETTHYGNYTIICTSAVGAPDWPDRTFKVDPIKPERRPR